MKRKSTLEMSATSIVISVSVIANILDSESHPIDCVFGMLQLAEHLKYVESCRRMSSCCQQTRNWLQNESTKLL